MTSHAKTSSRAFPVDAESKAHPTGDVTSTGAEPRVANPLTASPDAVHMGTGAGTAAAQSAVGRYYADMTDGGWTTTAPP